MKFHLMIAVLAAAFPFHLFAEPGQRVLQDFVAANDVTWTTLGTNENDSMPIGNGDLAANVWTEQNGDLVLLVAKSDALTEWGKLVKVGRVRLQMSPNPFAGAHFTQTLHLEDGTVEIREGANVLQIWADANQPAIHVQGKLDRPSALRAKVELWRSTKPDSGGMFELGGPVSIATAADTVMDAGPNEIAWCHFNTSSIYPIVLEKEHLGDLLPEYPDPLLHRCFGAALVGPKWTAPDSQTLECPTPQREVRLDLIALTETNVSSPQSWLRDLDLRVKQARHTAARTARAAHDQWWRDFWNRSWIHVDGTPDAARVSEGYLMQRYMLAASSRGALPVKFNGGLFTVGHDLPQGKTSNERDHSPDFRAWGNSYWNQNTRLLYWPLTTAGDFDLLEPWFDMYLNALPLARDRTRIYYHHRGASLPETMLFWGLPNLNDFGWNNPTVELQSAWQRYHIQGTLEVVAQMLDAYDDTGEPRYATELVPFADAMITYYAEHWPRDANGRIHMAPVQSLETYQLDAVNPTPDIAGLRSIIPRLVALPERFTTSKQREFWTRTLDDLPPIPTGKTARGKLPPEGVGDPDGRPTILPAEKYGKARNSENPELYVAFPYRLYGVGKPGLKLAQDTFAARLFPQSICWGQDGTEAAVLGLTREAEKAVGAEFTDYGDERFRWFWAAGHDWIPDLDNGGSGMITLQEMLMQCDGKRIQLLPAWPREWSADFKLHAPFRTTVEGRVEAGKIVKLQVTPESRAGDVVVLPPAD